MHVLDAWPPSQSTVLGFPLSTALDVSKHTRFFAPAITVISITMAQCRDLAGGQSFSAQLSCSLCSPRYAAALR
jgi:hypothetical protein